MADTEAPEVTEKPLPPYLRRLASGGDWHGCLTLENAELVAGRISRLLYGRRYSWAYHWGSPEADIELHTSAATMEVRVNVQLDHAFVSWSDGWSHQFYTTIRDRRYEAKLSYEEKRRDGIWLHFQGEQFTTDSYSISGNRCRGTFRIEVSDD